MTRYFTSSAVMIAALVVAAPAFAFTHHPATRAERAQTRDLNMQQLAIAQGHAPGNMQANTGAQPTDATTNSATPADQNAAPAAPNAPAAPQSNQQATPQMPQTNKAPADSQPTTPQQ
jgi:outer membrane biosynthesis protein TonB